jgi:hypothetical protein
MLPPSLSQGKTWPKPGHYHPLRLAGTSTGFCVREPACIAIVDSLYSMEKIGVQVYVWLSNGKVRKYWVINYDPNDGLHELMDFYTCETEWYKLDELPHELIDWWGGAANSSWDADKAVPGAAAFIFDSTRCCWMEGLIRSLDFERQCVQLETGETRTMQLQYTPVRYIPPSQVVITNPDLRAMVASRSPSAAARAQERLQGMSWRARQYLAAQEAAETAAAAGTGGPRC